MQRWVVFCWALLALVAAEECPDGGSCAKGQTCCSDPTNGYECCPLEQAECCGDDTHCCPAGTICNSATSSCVNATMSIPWVERASADQPRLSKSFRMIKTYKGEEDDNICPDQSRCPSEFSCLKALTKFGCCPLAQGVPCTDGKHCCPESHQCSEDSSSCIRKDLETVVLCNEGVSECPDQTTCCEGPEGTWGCCPMPKAVCCEDKLHCCPEGCTCDIQNSKCISSYTKKEMPMWAKLPARIRAEWENKKEAEEVTAGEANDGASDKSPKVTTAVTVPPSEEETSVSSVTKVVGGNDVPCNDTVACLDGSTCCQDQDHEWACCPLPEAVCCEDFIHCCPKGQKCNLTTQKCHDNTCSIPLVKKMSAIPRQRAPVGDVICDTTTSCEDGTTCCKNKTGGWACCPMPEAVCCQDHEHCCPKGKRCNLAAMTCDDDTGSVPWLQKVAALPRQDPQVGDVPCNATVACQDGTTCCKTKDGGWSCCPLPQAVCCEDHEHCCPEGKRCNLAAMTCDDDTGSVPWLQKVAALPRQDPQVGDVPCNATVACEDGTTCCKTKDGGWSCCPLPQAVCCEDHEHCCPKGKRCNLAAMTCDDDTGSVPWLQKVAALPRQDPQVGDVPCNATVACEDGTTCCKTKDGDWSCCPLPQAVCCEDHEHCCPEGKRCNLAAMTCDDDTGSVPWLQKVAALPRQDPQVGDVPCNATAACQDGTTCCKTKDGGWSCCPLPQAVCCEDHEHCCPEGKRCNLAAQTCDDDTGSVPWLQKVAALPRQDPQVGDVPCNATAACQDGTTCCKTKDGGWSCCPLPQAVCCDDHEHCCPHGTTCDLATFTCDDTAGSTPMKQKMPAFVTPAPTEEEPEEEPEEDETPPAQEEEDEDVKSRIKCDDQTSCPEHMTCCLIAKSHKWGCCPLPEAVCCASGDHCCPADYKCDERGTHCAKGELVIPSYTKLAATTTTTTTTTSSVQADSSSVQCDALNLCPERTTCCQLVTGEWGCCPLQNAVCCPDKEHCCPQGYSCHPGSTSCHKLIMLRLETVPLTPVYLPEHRPRPSPVKQTDIHCDDQTRCEEGMACCRMSSTTWGCCPFPNAVCCSDMTHCCPSGYTCSEAGVCHHDTRLNWNNWHMFLSNKKRALIV